MRLRATVFSLVVFGGSFGIASAFPSMSTYLKDGYKAEKDYQSFFTTVDSLKSKCEVCHKPGADKKAKDHGLNDFGAIYHDRFKPQEFKEADKAKKTEEAMKLFKDAWEKSISEKNGDGKIFGKLIKEGKIPGKNN